MVSPIDIGEPKLSQLTVSTKEVNPSHGNITGNGSHLDVTSNDHGLSMPTTPDSVRTSNGFETDIEGLKHERSSDHLRPSIGGPGYHSRSDGSPWPTQAHWREKALAAKRKNRSCQLMAGFSKRTRIIIQVVSVLLVIGIAVGVGYGVSKSLGARTWQPSDGK
ncbi:hypothetical protein F4808DRAFT_139037 [Astrocystis sublimbata]|nr:hypothetical protein F4808DRAFT_139037 [Astrocystis sublimbata]